MKPFVKELEHHDPLAVFASLEHLPYSLLLDSADRKHKNARYSFVLSHPIETIEFKDGKATLTNWDGTTTESGDPFEILKSRLSHWRENAEKIPGLPPFQGGAAGLFGYDLGRAIEKLPAKAKTTSEIPDMAIGIYDSVIAFDHKKQKCWIITHADSLEIAGNKQDYLLDLIEDTELTKAGHIELDWKANFTRRDYEQAIERTIQYIKEGDIFQANIAQRFDAKRPDDLIPFEHYLQLREINAAPFAAYMNIGESQISSASPERFLSVNDRRAKTQPIKGTSPVIDDEALNNKEKEKLLGSTKDKAENVMIVDLLRNDLSKCCKKDSVQVSRLCELQSFTSVHHLVSTITAELKDDQTPTDLLKACFPGGSITGAPKIRAQEIIDELEPTKRGPYCGSIGYIGFDGTMDTNILIRTLVYEKDNISLQSGGGITINSNPADEYQETLDKAKAILRSFETLEDENDVTIPLAS